MLDLTAVRRRYFPVKFNGRVLDVEPPKLKTLNKLVDLAKHAGNGDLDALADLTPMIAKLLSKNKKGIKINSETVEDALDFDQMQILLFKLFKWIAKERDDPN